MVSIRVPSPVDVLGEIFGAGHSGGGGKPPPYAVGINRPVRWFSVRTNGGTHRSRPTSYVGSSYVFVGDDAHIVPAVWSNDARYTRANPYQAVRKFDGAVCGPMWASAPTGCVPFNGPIPAAGHIGPALREHTGPGSGGAGGPLALALQQCEAWIEGAAALIPA